MRSREWELTFAALTPGLCAGRRLAASWTASETGLAIYVRVDSGWDPVASRSVRLGSLIDSRHSGELRKKLKSQSEGALMQVLRHRGTGASLLVATTHIFWDPAYPHVKACQAELACLAVRRLLSEQQHPTAVVLGGDWNSVPHLQPEFLPVMPTGALERLPPAWRRSAVYELLAAGRLVSDHPEHPDAFRNGARVSVAAASGGHAAVADRAEALDEGSLGGAANGASSAAPAVSVPAAPLPVAPCASPTGDPSPAGSNGEPPRTRPVPAGGRFASRLGPLTAHGLNLKDAYDGALCEGPLPLTTHAGQFKGALDYIWVSRGELDPAAGVRGSGTVGSCAEGIAGVGHLTFGSRAARVGTIAPATVVEVLNMPFDLVEPVAGWESFGPIPDRTWPSDHLAIGATVAVPGMGE